MYTQVNIYSSKTFSVAQEEICDFVAISGPVYCIASVSDDQIKYK